MDSGWGLTATPPQVPPRKLLAECWMWLTGGRLGDLRSVMEDSEIGAELLVAEARIEWLEAEIDRLRGIIQFMDSVREASNGTHNACGDDGDRWP